MSQNLLPTIEALQPIQADWLNNVATVYLQCRQYAKAQPLLLLLIKLCPHDLRPLKQLAYLYYQQGKYEPALQCCRRYEKNLQGVADGRLYLLRSFCHLQMGQKESALEYYQRFNALRTRT